MTEPYYRQHVFFCLNQREAGQTCCANHGSPALREYAKRKIKSLGLAGLYVAGGGAGTGPDHLCGLALGSPALFEFRRMKERIP